MATGPVCTYSKKREGSRKEDEAFGIRGKVCTYIYIYIERERERQRVREKNRMKIRK